MHGAQPRSTLRQRGSWRRQRRPPDERVDVGVACLWGGGENRLPTPEIARYRQLVVWVGLPTTSEA